MKIFTYGLVVFNILVLGMWFAIAYFTIREEKENIPLLIFDVLLIIGTLLTISRLLL